MNSISHCCSQEHQFVFSSSLDEKYFLEMGQFYKEKQNYTKALEYFTKLNKCPHAMLEIGMLHEKGLGIPLDINRANLFYKRAEELFSFLVQIQLCAESMFQLALMYEKGMGVPQDVEKAFDLCRKAAQNKHEKAEKYIKVLEQKLEEIEEEQSSKRLSEILRVRQIYKETKESSDRSAAMITLGDMYKKGDIVKQSYQRANYWYSKAGNEVAQEKKVAIKNDVKNEIAFQGKERMKLDPILTDEKGCAIM